MKNKHFNYNTNENVLKDSTIRENQKANINLKDIENSTYNNCINKLQRSITENK